MHKYGVELYKSVQHASELDSKNNMYTLDYSLQKEMRNIGLGLEILENDASLPVGWETITWHLIWAIL